MPTRRCSRCATASWPTARASTWRTAPGAARTRWPRSSRSSTTRPRSRFRRRSSGRRRSARAEALESLLEERRQGPVELRHAQRGDKRRLYELAQRNARLALEQEKLRTQRRREQRVDALNDLREVLELDALPVRIECFDISNLGPSHTVASMVVFEGGAPKKSDYRRFKIRDLNGRQDDFAAMARCSRAAWRSTPTSASARRTTRPTTPASRRFRA